MASADVVKVERDLNVVLPAPYRSALATTPLSGNDDDHPEFLLSATELVKENTHFTFDPDDFSDLEKGMLGTFMRWLRFGTRKKLLERRRKWRTEWALGQRFVIGSDLGEERYYIVLSELDPKVYCYELESGQSREVANSIAEWLSEVRRRQEEGVP